MWRSTVRSLAETLLLRAGPAHIARRRRPNRTAILAFHNVIPQSAPTYGDKSLHLRLDRFEALLQAAEDIGAEFVTLSQALRDGGAGLRVVVTADDAYSGWLDLAVPCLEARGIPSTLFVAPALLGAGSPWWDRMAEPQGLSPAVREEMLLRRKGRDANPPGVPAEVPHPSYAIAEEDAVRAAAESSLVTLEGHSWSHPNLASLGREELGVEFARCQDWFTTQGHPSPTYLSYPYGLTNPLVGECAEAAGFRGGLLVDGGLLTEDRGDMWIPRINVPAGLSPQGFALRLSGWFSQR